VLASALHEFDAEGSPDLAQLHEVEDVALGLHIWFRRA
jgi:hypothetical protein